MIDIASLGVGMLIGISICILTADIITKIVYCALKEQISKYEEMEAEWIKESDRRMNEIP